MKITRDDIKEMVKETIEIINERINQKDFHPFWDKEKKKFIDGFNFDVFKSYYPGKSSYDEFENVKNNYIAKYTKANFWDTFFSQYKTISYDDAIPILKDMGHKIPTRRSFDVRKAEFFRHNTGEKELRNNIQKEKIQQEQETAILSLKEWFNDNGGLNVTKDKYQITICILANECDYKITESFLNNISEKENKTFYDFIQVFKLKNNYEFNITDDYLLYCACRFFNKDVSEELDTFENRRRFYNDYNFKQRIEHFKKGDQQDKTKTFCKIILQNLHIKDDDVSTENIQLLTSRIYEYGGYSFLIKEYNWLKNKTRDVKPSYEIDILSNVLHLMFYIISYKSLDVSKIFNYVPQTYYDAIPQILRMAFGVKYYLQYGENYLKLDNLIDKNDATLFNPYSNSLSKEYICGILRNCIDLNIPQLNNKLGLPVEEIISYWGNCYSFMALTNTDRYGGDNVLNWDNLLNPNFSAEEAIEQAGADKFAKGKFKKTNKRGEVVNLSFYDFMMWEVKIKEVTQKEIYFFLSNNTTVPWKYEYNRYDKQADEELGRKSIDIFNEKNGICIEYQGEQHFRPNGVKGDDDDSIEMVLLGLKEKGIGPISKLKNEIRGIVNGKQNFNNLENLIKDRLIQMCETYIQVPIFKEAYTFLQQGKDPYSIETIRGNVENHYIKRVISVKRFLDEANVIKQQGRDIEKSKAVKSKNWNMLYILPGRKNAITNDDMNLVVNIVGDNYFFWQQDKQKLLNYLSSTYNIVKYNNSNTLFEQIVKELLK